MRCSVTQKMSRRREGGVTEIDFVAGERVRVE